MTRFVATILGCGPSPGVPRIGNDWGTCDPNDQRNRRSRCALLVERREDGKQPTRVLVDTSPDIRTQLLAAGVDHIDGVLYTHAARRSSPRHRRPSRVLDEDQAAARGLRRRPDIGAHPRGLRVLLPDPARRHVSADPPHEPDRGLRAPRNRRRQAARSRSRLTPSAMATAFRWASASVAWPIPAT